MTAARPSPASAPRLSLLERLRPTRFGWAFMGLTLLTLIGCINYGLSLGYGLTFLLSALWVTGAAQARRLSQGLALTLHAPAEAVAGRPLTFQARLAQSGGAGGVLLRGWATQNGVTRPIVAHGFVAAGGNAALELPLEGAVRGPLRFEATLFATDPFGMWFAHSGQKVAVEVLVTPTPELSPPVPPTLAAVGEGDTAQRMAGNDDFAGLRPYVAGDAPRLISWRHAARTGQLVSREFDAPLGKALSLDWHAAAPAGDTEARLSRLAAWAELARQTQTPFRLTLPGVNLGVGSGEAHVRAALQALAQYGPLPTPERPEAAAPSFLERPAWLSGPQKLPVAPPLLTLPLQFSLLALGVAMLPGFLRQPFWNTALIVGLLVYRALQADPARKLRPLPPVPMLALAIGAGLGLNAAYGSLLGADGGTAILALLVALKAAETNTVRDARLLSLLGLFMVSTHFFHDQGPLTLLHVLLATTLLLSAAAGWVSAPPRALVPRALLSLTGRLLAYSLPMAALLFVFFPRPDGPLWQLPVQQGTQTGLSDSITAGSFSNLAQSTQVAFRADFQGALPPQEELYWRGPIYEAYDGVTWQQVRQRFPMPSVELRREAPVYSYSLTLEPSGKQWLLALDTPQTFGRGTFLTSGFQAVSLRPAGLRSRYDWQSRAAQLGRVESADRLNLNLMLPSDPAARNPQALALADSWRTLSAEQKVQAALQFFAQNGFSYTLSPPTLPEENRIDAFLYGSKQGFCEHYSSAFAFLMRAAGVPTRIVGGYQGAETNPNGGYLIVRQQNAHAWNEVWLQGQGWVRVDPTGVVAPARIRADLATALAQPGAARPREKTPLEQLRLRYDALQNQWNTWVASYDGEQQRSLLSRFGVSSNTSPAYLLTVLLLAALALLPAIAFARRAARPRDPALAALYDLTLRLGLPREPGETASAYAERAAAEHPAQAGVLSDIVQTFNALRYGRETDPNALKHLRELVRQVKR